MKTLTLSSLVALVLGVLGLIVGLFVDPQRFYFSYLTAWSFFVSIAIGALFLVMIGHAAKARWFGALRRVSEIPMASMPLFLLLIVPIFFGLPHLYEWAGPLEGLDAETRRLIEHKRAWMNVPFFIVRSLVWLGICSLFAILLLRGSFAMDRRYEEKTKTFLYRLSSGGLVALAFVVTWASFDWLMSLDSTWYSTIFGVYYFAGGFAAALAVLAIMASVLNSRGLLPAESAVERQTAVGRLLLAFVIFWAYQGFSQLLIIWIANIPGEVGFYQRRAGTGWGWVSFLLVMAHFAVPFAFLLSRDIKRRAVVLSAISIWILGAHYIDMYWLVMPNLTPEGVVVHWLDLAALLAFFGLLGLFSITYFRRRSLVSDTDPYFHQSLRYQSWP